MEGYPLSIFCHNCYLPTSTIEPLIIKRFTQNKIRLEGVCGRCLVGKAKQYSFKDFSMIEDIPIGELFINYIITKGKLRRIYDIFNKYINPD